MRRGLFTSVERPTTIAQIMTIRRKPRAVRRLLLPACAASDRAYMATGLPGPGWVVRSG